MQRKAILRNMLMLLAVTVTMIASVQGQKVDAPMVLDTGASTCKADDFVPKRLEANSRVLQAGTGTAIQLVANANSEGKSDVSGLEAGLIDELASSALKIPYKTDCSSQSKNLAAQGTTGQTNKQVGAASGSDGSTSAVEQTGVAELLGIAVENGAVTNNVNGTTMTLSTSLYGLAKGFGGIKDTAEDYNKCPFCLKFGASATFNVANTTDPLQSATRKQVSQWQLKYSFFDLSTRSPKVEEMWKRGPQSKAASLAANLSPVPGTPVDTKFELLKTAIDQALTAKQDDIQLLIVKAKTANTSSSGAASSGASGTSGSSSSSSPSPMDDLTQKILSTLDQDENFQEALQAAIQDKDFDTWVTTGYSASLQAYMIAESKFEAAVQNLSKGKNGFNGDLTFGEQYPTTHSTTAASGSTAIRPMVTTTTTTTSTVPVYLIGAVDLSWQPITKANPKAGTPPVKGKSTVAPVQPPSAIPSITLNFKSSYYPNPNASLKEKTFRGGKAAVQTQWNLGKNPFVSDSNDKSQITFSLNGSYERLQENEDQKGKKPDLILGNAKLTIPISKGVSFPLAVTFANSSAEQAKGAYTIGNFGISFDLDKLAALLKAK